MTNQTILENLYERTLQVSQLKKENALLRKYVAYLEKELANYNKEDTKCQTMRK